MTNNFNVLTAFVLTVNKSFTENIQQGSGVEPYTVSVRNPTDAFSLAKFMVKLLLG